MCKILILTGIDPAKHRKTEAFIKASVKPLSKGNDDGFGYAAISHNGLTSERWLNNKDAFKQREGVSQGVKTTVDRLGSLVESEDSYTRHGDINTKETFKGTTSVIVHARFATCDVTLDNVHPFIADDTALIHNGVIRNTEDLTNKTSSCDSECILNEYTSQGVSDNSAEIQGVADAMRGYYACGVFSKDSADRWILDVFKDTGARLIAARIPSLGENAVVFCTNRMDLFTAAKKARVSIRGICEVNPGVLMRFDARTGATVESFDFDCTGKSAYGEFSLTEGLKWPKGALDAGKTRHESYIDFWEDSDNLKVGS